MTCEELLTLSLNKRILWLRSKDGPEGVLSHDKLAAKLETTRQTVISWERGTEPKRFADKIAEFSGCPRETWLRGEEEVAVDVTSLGLLRELQETIESQGQEMTRALRSLARDVRALRRKPDDEAHPASGTGP